MAHNTQSFERNKQIRELKKGKKTTNELLEEILLELKKQNQPSGTGGGTYTYPQYPPSYQSYCPRCGQLYFGLHSCGGIMGTPNITC